jgi:hypothetical protein
MFNIELESYNVDLKKWNRNLFVRGRAEKLLIHLQTAEFLIGESRFTEALRMSNEVWEHSIENGKEDEPKLKCKKYYWRSDPKGLQLGRCSLFYKRKLAMSHERYENNYSCFTGCFTWEKD